ncbi:FAD binding domain-containing protein [Pantanalinema rosaneae CENA516]|uniref:FAD binding domain-containing protein n=1 Tax=Pantanalinema rosaneae TaxID=1620701 RepID=UPI003D6F5382
MKNFAYIRATSVQEAVQQASTQPSTMFIAGGTNLVDRMKAFLDQPDRLIDITRLDMTRIESGREGIRIGALVSNTAVADHAEIRRNYPMLSRAILLGASQQIRNVATVGGNLLQRTRCPYYYDPAFACNKRNPGSGCAALTGINRMHAIFGASDQCIAVHPSDMCVPLAALDAIVEVAGSQGTRQIPFTEFHRLPGDTPQRDSNLQPGELITAIVLPPLPWAQSSVYLKLRDRASYAFALISVAAAMQVTGDRIQAVRLAMGGVAHKPWRLTVAEQFLIGKPVQPEILQQAAELAMQSASPLPDNRFKVELSQRAIRRALTIAANGGGVA